MRIKVETFDKNNMLIFIFLILQRELDINFINKSVNFHTPQELIKLMFNLS